MGELETRELGAATVLFGPHSGKYPDGNSLLVRGREESLLVDPSLGLLPRRGALPAADRLLLSHCHEDHVAGLHLFPDLPCHVHEDDRPGLLSLDHFMAIYGFPEEIETPFRKVVVEQFHYEPRPDAQGFADGAIFELGGDVRVRVLHAPGHTRGHCVLHVEPDDALYLGDIDLSSFGPYYGDAWSSLEDFERSLAFVRDLEARFWVTFHHIGVIDDRAAFLERLERYTAVIERRERALLAFLCEPRNLQDIAAHRFVYRPGDAVAFADPVERRSMGQHIERLVAQGRVKEVEAGRFLALDA